MNAYVQSDNNNQVQGIYAMAIAINPSEPYTDFLFCTYLADRGMEKEALAHVEKTLQKAQKTGESDDYFDLLMEEQTLGALRTSDSFQEIVHQFFPNRKE